MALQQISVNGMAPCVSFKDNFIDKEEGIPLDGVSFGCFTSVEAALYHQDNHVDGATKGGRKFQARRSGRGERSSRI